jgi:hypothetical protein
MPLRSLPSGGSCPCSAACPTSCRPDGAVLPPPASTPTCHLETLPPPAFFAVLHATTVPVDCSFANSASALAGTRSSTAFLLSLFVHARQRRPPLLSLCSWARPSIRCDKNAPRTTATALPGRTPPGFPPAPSTCLRRTAVSDPDLLSHSGSPFRNESSHPGLYPRPGREPLLPCSGFN